MGLTIGRCPMLNVTRPLALGGGTTRCQHRAVPYAERHKAFGLEWKTTRHQHRAVPYAECHKAFGLGRGNNTMPT